MSWQVGVYSAIILAPLLAFAVGILAGRWMGRWAGYVSTGAIGLSFVLSLIGGIAYLSNASGIGREPTNRASKPLTWRFDVPFVALGQSIPPMDGKAAGQPLTIPFGLAIDNLTVLMVVMITSISLVVHLFSLSYMRGDRRFSRFFAYLSLFCASMLALVMSSNLFFVFVFWELVGFCSYLLIGFWQEEKANVDAANKAFLVNRLGDVGMLVGLGILWTNLGTLDIDQINHQIRDANGTFHVSNRTGVAEVELISEGSGPTRHIRYGLLVLAGLGIFAGCVGKSAQFPLQFWLPDAMVGPTPVSALIHAATMVAAGVYLVARIFPLFTPEVLLTIAYVGGLTVFIASTIALVQSDYKKVLAYSTVSQLGFMMVGLGVGGRSAGLFHLLTHAYFKALLFLGAGSVFHAVHTYEMPRLGGLHRRLRITSLTMLVATLAISGVPFFSGFASKDAILASALHFVIDQPEHVLLFLFPVLGATVTAFVMFRLWFLIFAGQPRSPAASRAVEGDRWLTWPLIALAIPTIALGWPIPGFGFKPILEQVLEYGEPIDSVDPGSAAWWAFGASILVLSIGSGLSVLSHGPWDRWRRFDSKKTASRFGPIHEFLVQKWYFDELYQTVIVGPILRLARAIGWFDRKAVDGLVNGSAESTRRLSRFEGVFDRVAVDGLVRFVAWGAYATGNQARRLQTGSIRTYLMILAIAFVGICAFMFAWVLA